jgi:crossover junction endodeoxyribonuclease RuvC
MRVIGIDPGTAIVGYGIVDFDGKNYTVIGYGCIYTNKEHSMEDRLVTIYDELDLVIKKYQPDSMAVEELFFFKNNKTVISVGQARGVLLLCGKKNNLSIAGYTPLQVKMGVTGYGRADKIQVQKMVTTILKLEKIPEPDDAADGIAIAVTHINTVTSSVLSLKESIKTNKKSGKVKNKMTIEEYKSFLGKR